MKRIAASYVLAGLMSLTSAWAASPPVLPIEAAASAPRLSAMPAPPASAPTTSPAVKAAKDASQPGKVRPESAVVPQLSLTLPSSKPSADAVLPPPAAANRKPDDRAAACAAHTSKVEREKCQRSL